MSLLNKLDFYKINRSWKIHGKDHHSTNLSLFFSFFLIIVMILKFIKIISDSFIYNEVINEKINFISDDNIEIKFDDFKLAICIIDKQWMKNIKWEENFYISYHYRDDNQNILNFTVNDKCEKSKDEIFYNKTFNVNYDECVCLNSKNVSLNTPKANFDSGTFIVRIKAKNNDIVDDSNILMQYTNYFFDYNENPPFKQNFGFIFDTITNNNTIYSDLYINKLSYETIYDVDLFKFKSDIKDKFIFSDKIIKSSEPNYENVKCEYYFTSNRKQINYEITLFSIDYLFAVCGGLFQLLHLLFYSICGKYNEYSLDEELKKLFSDEMKIFKTKLVTKKLIGKSINNNYKRENSINQSSILQFYNQKFNISRRDIEINYLLDKFGNSLDFKVFYDLLNEFIVLKKLIFNSNNIDIFYLLEYVHRCKTKSLR